MTNDEWTGFFLHTGAIYYKAPDRVLSYADQPVVMLIDLTNGFIQAGCPEAMQARIDRFVQADPGFADDLVLVPVHPTPDSIAQANIARDNPTKAVAIARQVYPDGTGNPLVTAALQ